MQPVGDFMTNEPGSRRKPFQAELAFFIAPFYRDQYPGRAAIFRQFDRCNGGQTDSRISQFPFHHGLDLFPQGFSHALTVIFRPALLHTSPRNKTDENIRNCGQEFVKGMMREIGNFANLSNPHPIN